MPGRLAVIMGRMGVGPDFVRAKFTYSVRVGSSFKKRNTGLLLKDEA